MATITQDGIQSGVYAVAAELEINGSVYPWETITTTLNLYGVASKIECEVPRRIQPASSPYAVASVVRDFGAEAQALAKANAYMGLAVRIGYGPYVAGGPLRLAQLESGFVDETHAHALMNMVEIVGRSEAARFQDTFVDDAAQFTQRGDQVVALFAQQKGFTIITSEAQAATAQPPTFVIIQSPGQNVVGKPGYTQNQYFKANRSRSMWDEMRDAALADRYVLTLHNGVGYYGPPLSNPPTVALKWGRDLDDYEIIHAAKRSHSIVVRYSGFDHKTGLPIVVAYGYNGFSSGGQISAEATQYPYWAGTTDRATLRKKAYSTWWDIVTHELTCHLFVTPDPQLMALISKVGASFVVQLTTDCPSECGTYFIRQVVVRLVGGDTNEPSLTLELVGSNIDPLADPGELSELV